MTDNTLDIIERIYKNEYGEEWSAVSFVDRHGQTVASGIRRVLSEAPPEYDELLQKRLNKECDEGQFTPTVPICAINGPDLNNTKYECDDQHNIAFAGDAYKGKATITVMHPQRFLDMSAPLYGPGEDTLASLATALEDCDPIQTPYLDVDLKACQVTKHEGRHRSTAAVDHGVEKMPVIIYHDPPQNDKERACLKSGRFARENRDFRPDE